MLLVQTRKGGILENLKAPFFKPVLAIKLFLLETPVNKAHKELDMAYNTAYKVYNKIREAIYQLVKEEVEELRIRCPYLVYLKEKGKREWG